MVKEAKFFSATAEKSFLNTFLNIVDHLSGYKLPMVITNISEKRQLTSHFYCLVIEDHSLVLTKRFPGKKVVYALNLSDFELDTFGVSDEKTSYTGLVTSLRQILMDLKSREARILRKP
jgi:hypothetical protein